MTMRFQILDALLVKQRDQLPMIIPPIARRSQNIQNIHQTVQVLKEHVASACN